MRNSRSPPARMRHNCVSNSGWTKSAFEKVVDQLIRQKEIVTDGNLLRLSSHQIQFSAEEENIKEKVEGIFLDAGINTPAMTELTAQLPEYPPQSVQQTFYALMNLGRFIRIGDDLFIHTQIFEEIVNSLTDYLQKNDIITVAEFRELAQTSRKYAVPFLEYCDGQGLTIREGKSPTATEISTKNINAHVKI